MTIAIIKEEKEGDMIRNEEKIIVEIKKIFAEKNKASEKRAAHNKEKQQKISKQT